MSPQPIGLRRLSWAGALAASLAVLLLPLPVSAHSDLQSSDPAEGAVVPSPFSGPIALTFTESLAAGSKADLYAPGHQLVASATIDAGTMTVTLSSPLAAGGYTVEWVSIADDGDLLRGTLAFSVAAAASPTASETATPSPSPAPSGDTGGTGSDVILPIVIVVIAAAASAYFLVRRSRPA